jgi:hypothetical protein
MTSFGILWGNWRSFDKPETFSPFVAAISVLAHASTLPRQQTLMFSGRHPRSIHQAILWLKPYTNSPGEIKTTQLPAHTNFIGSLTIK